MNIVCVYVRHPSDEGEHVKIKYRTTFGDVVTTLRFDDDHADPAVAAAMYLSFLFSGGMDLNVWHEAVIGCVSSEMATAVMEMLSVEFEGDLTLARGGPEKLQQYEAGCATAIH